MRLFKNLRKQKRKLAIVLLAIFLFELGIPTASYALTGGPSQPEVQSFQPAGVSDLVDPFTGDFSYNIPLMDVDGYPLNLGYQSGSGMDDEASWVGLGWNLNPGCINRTMRGIPDDFKGDPIIKEFYAKPNRTYGVSGTLSGEIAGLELPGNARATIGGGITVTYNNYSGYSFEQSLSPGISSGDKAKVPLTASLGFSASARDGLTITPQVGVSFFPDARNSLGLNIASSFNSKTGLKELSYNMTYTRNSTAIVTRTMRDGTQYKTGERNRRSATGGISSGGFTFGMPSYTPQVTMPFKTSTFTYTPKAGAAIFLTDALIGGSGFYSEQKLRTEQIVSNAYGYMNSQYGQDNLSAIHDFNREKDAAYDPKKTANLPLTVHTYDQFSVTGHGVGGSFRPYRSDIGYVFDPEMETSDQSLSAGVNAGVGNVIKVGVDVAATQIKTRSQAWLHQNGFAQRNKFKSQKVNDAFEPYYFKQQGELTVDYTPAQDNLDNDNLYQYTSSPIAVTGVNNTTVPELNPVSIKLNTSGKPFKGENKFKRYDFGSLKDETIDLQNKTLARTTRRKRSNNFTMLTVAEAKKSGMLNSSLYSGMPDHHIGQITITKPDGSRYIYGLPVYNKKQVEVSFAVGKGTSKNPIADNSDGDPNNGIIQYPTGTDARNNGQGIDEHFNKVTTPGYAYAFMLTAIVSADYSDIDDVQGPSKGDMGTYTKFNYQKQNYNWRTPQGERTAYLDKGLITLEEDDRASYVYGEKELAYVASIESKNHKAVFDIETRFDALGVQENGKVVSTSTSQQYLLKAIKLYSTLMGESNKKLLKTVNFEYNYTLSGLVTNSLESGGDNTNRGKLTLKKVYFTYQNSNRAKFSPYTFSYSTNNPNYKAKAVDRWGNYYPGSTPDFPYSVQDATDANDNSDAWQLTKIETPSGGEIEIDYEADTYAYVQNRKANQMFKVAGFYSGTNPPGSLSIVSNELYSNNWRDDVDKPSWVIVKLEGDAVASINSPTDAKTKLIGDLKKLYFRLNIMVNEKTGDPKHEYVPGYADIASGNNVSYFVDGGNKYVAVKVEKVSLKDRAENGKKLSPFVFAALQFSRLYTSKYVDGTPNATDGMQAIDVINLLLNSGFMSNIRETIQGPNKSMLSKGFCKHALLTDNARPSFVRLLNPTGKKYGGGSRVAKIMLRDSNVSGMPQDMAYGQMFDYNLSDGTSSGVAAYEPMLGADENPFRQPVSMSTDRQQRVLIPDDRFFQEEPFGESFFPSPVVGYSQVRIYSLAEGEESVPGKRDGFIQKEFYTAKDFPTVTARSAPVKPETYARFRIIPRVIQFATVAQGYTVMLNDMHGKPKAEWVYGKGNNGPISGKEYKFHTHENSTPSNASLLKNTVDVIKPDGSVVTDARLGVETDIVVDVRQAETETEVIGANGNGEITVAGIIPLATAIVLPRLKYEKVTFRSAVTTKVVYKYGLLSETIVHDNTARVKQQNLAYDAENSNVILSLTQNEYRDPIYSFTIPAHWAYEGMGGAYKNEGMVIDLGGGNAQGTYSLSSTVASKLHPGDELIQDGLSLRFYVIQKYGNTVIIGRQDGSNLLYQTTGGKLKIIRSGRRNMMMANVGQVISAKNPINTTTKKVEFTAANNIIDASAMEFSDNWQVYCNCFNKGQTVVPYYYGIKGNWRPLKSYHYLTNRRSENNRRVDGYFDNFSSYWVYSGGEWKTNATGWVWNTETTLYDPRSGAPMEEKDALMRYSTEYPRFNHSLTNAASKNTRRMELYYESFEDYKQEGEPCDELTEKFTNGGSNLDNKKSHTGRNSIKVTSTTPDTERKLKIRSCDLEAVNPNN